MITIFDLGKDNSNKSLAHSIRSYMQSNKDREVTIHYSNDTDIKDCIGCWNCWWKSPGKCALKDEAFKLYKDYINSDEVVILFDTENGFIDSKGKTFIDRLIQHFMPYVKMRNGECCHLKRYDKYPLINFYFNKSSLSNDEITVIKNYLARSAYHFYSTCKEILYDKESIDIVDLACEKPMGERLAKDVTERKPKGKWVIYNGSPRGHHSNSKLMIEKIVMGMKAQGVEEVEVRYLINTKEHKMWAADFACAENNLFVFPLYVHAMPGSVMKFFDQMESIGRTYAHKGMMDIELKKYYEKTEYLSKASQLLYSILSLTKLTNYYWDYNLKKNGAYKERFARPYECIKY